MDLVLDSTTEDSTAETQSGWVLPENFTAKELGPHAPYRNTNKDAAKKDIIRFTYFRKHNWKRCGDSKKSDSNADIGVLTCAPDVRFNKVENQPRRPLMNTKKMSNYSLPVKKSSTRMSTICAQRHHYKKLCNHAKREDNKGGLDMKHTNEDNKSSSSCNGTEACEVPELPPNQQMKFPTTPKKCRDIFPTPRQQNTLKTPPPTRRRCTPLRSNTLERPFHLYNESVLKMSKIACSVLHDNSEEGINRFMSQLRTQILHELMSNTDEKSSVDAQQESSGDYENVVTPEKHFFKKSVLIQKNEELPLVRCSTSLLQETLVKSPSIKDVPKTHGKYSFLSMSSKPYVGVGKVKVFFKEQQPWMPKVVEYNQDESREISLNEPLIEEA